MDIEDIEVGQRVRRIDVDRNLTNPMRVLVINQMFNQVLTKNIATGGIDLWKSEQLTKDD